MIIGICDYNDSNFAVEVSDNENIELVKRLMIEGLDAWYMSANEEIEATEHFSIDDIERFYNEGFSVPTDELLTMHNINHKIIDLEVDENDNFICDVLIRN